MITAKPTEHLNGIMIEGEYDDFSELVDSIYRMTGLDHLPAEYHLLIRDAIREYSESAVIAYDNNLAVRYAEYVIKQIQA